MNDLDRQLEDFSIRMEAADEALAANREMKKLELELEAETMLLAAHSRRWFLMKGAAEEMLAAFDAIIVQCGDGTMPRGWLSAANRMRQVLNMRPGDEHPDLLAKF